MEEENKPRRFKLPKMELQEIERAPILPPPRISFKRIEYKPRKFKLPAI